MKLILKTFLFIIFSINAIANGIWVWDTKEDWEKLMLLDCNTNSQKGSVKILNTFSDDFNLPQLSNFWNFGFIDVPGNTFNFNTTGCIRLISYPYGYGWWCIDSTKEPPEALIYQLVNKKYNFEIETCLKNSSLYHHPWGGLTFFVSDENKTNTFRIGYGSRQYEVPQGFCFYCRDICHDYVYWSYYSLPYPIYFKIKNEYNEPYNNLTFYYRYNTTTAWTQVYKFENKNFNKMFVGISMSDTEPNQWADFDYFYYYGPVTKRAEINSGLIDLGSEPVGQGIIRWVQNLQDLSVHPIEFYTQTSDDGIIWSEAWKGPYTNNNGSNILSTNKRYIRFKGILKTDDERYSPELHRLEIEYPLAAPNAPKITATVKEDGWTNTHNAIFYFSEADNNGVTVAGYYYSIDSEVNTRSMYTNVNYVRITNIAEGKHKLSVMAQADYRNNSLCSGISEYDFNIDITKPKGPEVKKSSHKQYEESGNNNFEIELILEDDKVNTTNVSGIAGISYKLTRNEKEEVDDIIDEEGNKIRISGIDNGVWYFRVKAIDKAGNSSEILTYCIKIDFKGEILAKEKVKIYPNPTKGKFKIWYELTGEAERVRIMIKDSGGRTFKEVEGGIKAGINEIEQELNGLSNGVYFVKIKVNRKDGKEDKIVKKVVVYRR